VEKKNRKAGRPRGQQTQKNGGPFADGGPGGRKEIKGASGRRVEAVKKARSGRGKVKEGASVALPVTRWGNAWLEKLDSEPGHKNFFQEVFSIGNLGQGFFGIKQQLRVTDAPLPKKEGRTVF